MSDTCRFCDLKGKEPCGVGGELSQRICTRAAHHTGNHVQCWQRSDTNPLGVAHEFNNWLRTRDDWMESALCELAANSHPDTWEHETAMNALYGVGGWER